ncbi:hypothetical protein ACLQ3H_00730 [Micromonospora saelicesensis]|uniref:hypothetical protein n=1 Tax=Micromonospora saelicesensis TaxID=285676 RepID=UPI003CEF6AAF
MIFRNRPLARLGAVALLAGGLCVMAAAPATAAPDGADLSIKAVVGTKVAEGQQVKTAFAKVTNSGPGTPSALVIKADTSQIDWDTMAVFPAGGDCSGEGAGKPVLWTCVVAPEDIPGPGETVELPIVLIKRTVAVDEPYSAPITVTIESPSDTTPGNNSATARIDISNESGVDVGVIATDVKTALRLVDGVMTEQAPLYAGDNAVFVGEIVNQGDRIAKGLEFTVQLPKDVTFTEQYEACEYSADKRTATCTDKEFLFGEAVGALITFPIAVAAGVTAPAALPDGSLAAKALGVAPVGTPVPAAARRSAIKNVKAVAAAERVTDVDPSDDRDDFAVIVAAKAGSGGGDNPGGNPGEGGQGGSGGGLPVTGVQAGLIGGIGAAVLITGGVMVLVARRRRVVLVTPGDERTAG